MSGTEFGQQFINALSLGSIYALVAIGLAMVFSILRLINFAHGEVLMLGAFFTYYAERAGFPFLPAAVIGVGGTIIAGLLMERVAYRPLRGAPEIQRSTGDVTAPMAADDTDAAYFAITPLL